MDKVRAIFVSHEHSDHIRGIPVLARKYNLPVYITETTLRHSGLSFNKLEFLPFEAYIPIQLGELSITAFPKLHDAIDPHSFVVTYHQLKIGVFTDIGSPCQHLIKHMQECHAVFLEANYDEDMLANGRYPYYLKRRISSDTGHLSNWQALELLMTYKPAHLSHVLLSHLSQENNSPHLVESLFATHNPELQVVVASRYQETAVFSISNTPFPSVPRKPVTVQTELFPLF
ncbi:MBL fold metallo-hydrolase [Rhodocytophaga rosea]|uniref:MBL fold metallo-hydrolase n=1 Tax=Rhodocytophaga rosea TaxID=2704465 RepID=UPI00293BB7B3|nr:MBL fold metallo-hydrolase [Rhodocytophaga rosea]